MHYLKYRIFWDDMRLAAAALDSAGRAGRARPGDDP